MCLLSIPFYGFDTDKGDRATCHHTLSIPFYGFRVDWLPEPSVDGVRRASFNSILWILPGTTTVDLSQYIPQLSIPFYGFIRGPGGPGEACPEVCLSIPFYGFRP